MTQRASGLFISLSAGGTSDELAAHGLGIEHVEEFMVRLAMKLLRDGHRLAFGGTLANSEQRLTKFLIDAATSWIGDESAKQCKVTQPETWPLVNYWGLQQMAKALESALVNEAKQMMLEAEAKEKEALQLTQQLENTMALTHQPEKNGRYHHA